MGEVFNNASIGIRYYENGKGCANCQKDGKIGVRSQGTECFIGAIGRGRKTISTETNPGKDGMSDNL